MLSRLQRAGRLDLSADPEVFFDAERRGYSSSLGHQRQAARDDFVGRRSADARALELDGVGPRPIQADDGIEQRALAGAVGSDDRDDLPGLHFEVEAVKRLDVAIEGFEASDFEQGWFRHRLRCPYRFRRPLAA